MSKNEMSQKALLSGDEALAFGAYEAGLKVACACALKEIIAISIPDKVGNFELLTSALAQNNINVKDAYGFVLQTNLKGVCCLVQ